MLLHWKGLPRSSCLTDLQGASNYYYLIERMCFLQVNLPQRRRFLLLSQFQHHSTSKTRRFTHYIKQQETGKTGLRVYMESRTNRSYLHTRTGSVQEPAAWKSTVQSASSTKLSWEVLLIKLSSMLNCPNSDSSCLQVLLWTIVFLFDKDDSSIIESTSEFDLSSAAISSLAAASFASRV